MQPRAKLHGVVVGAVGRSGERRRFLGVHGVDSEDRDLRTLRGRSGAARSGDRPADGCWLGRPGVMQRRTRVHGVFVGAVCRGGGTRGFLGVHGVDSGKR